MQYLTRKLIRPRHLNAAGNLFGGQALMWIDEEAAIFASGLIQKTLEKPRIVTLGMSTVRFQSPAGLGDILTIGCALVKVGTTSVTVECEIRNKTTGKTIVHVDKIVFVSLGENDKPTPHFLPKQEQ